MMFWARCRFPCNASTCSSVQQTLVSFHSSPQTETSLSLKPLSGASASPLSGHGSSEPNSDCLPQCPRMAQRPASCFSVVGPLLAARAVPSSHGAQIDALITRRDVQSLGMCSSVCLVDVSKKRVGMYEGVACSVFRIKWRWRQNSRDTCGDCFQTTSRQSPSEHRHTRPAVELTPATPQRAPSRLPLSLRHIKVWYRLHSNYILS